MKGVRSRLYAVSVGLFMILIGFPGLYADEVHGKIARLGAVYTISRSAMSPGYTVDFWERLRELGWERGKNILVEERHADGDLSRMPALMQDVVSRHVDLILTTTEAGAIAAERVTKTIPIVATSLGDPVSAGLAASLSRPGGNVTGLSLQRVESIGKMIELVRELVPRFSVLAILWNPQSPLSQMQLKEAQAKVRGTGIETYPIEIRSRQDFASAFDRAHSRAQAALVLSNPVAYQHRQEVTSLATKYHLPTVYNNIEFVPDGGLIAYAADLRVMYRRAAEYVDKILRGANPAELPIDQATEYKLAVNLKAAKALGITIPESILVRADEVIR